jgi:serine/threonine-protein kinase
MSPEQARGLDVDHHADNWALCVVLYEAVTGRLPFEGKTYNAILRSIIEDTPAPITSFAAGDEKLWAILERGFRKNADERWPSMRELGCALAGWLEGHGVHEDVAGTSLHVAWTLGRRRVSSESSLPPARWQGGVDQGPETQVGGEAVSDDAGGPSFDVVLNEPPPRLRSRTPLIAGAVVVAAVATLAIVWMAQGTDASIETRPATPAAAEAPSPARGNPNVKPAEPEEPAAPPAPRASASVAKKAPPPASKATQPARPSETAKPQPGGKSLGLKTEF